MNSEEKANKLAQGIANARKVMQKVEGGNYNNDQNTNNGTGASYPPKPNYNEKEPEYISEAEMRTRVTSKNTGPKKTMKNLDSSKMPKEILESFLNNPINDPTVPVGLDNVISKVNETQNSYDNAYQSTEPEITKEVIVESKAPVMDTNLIEYIIKKTVEETIDKMSKNTSIDETIQIKIGEKTFGGKLMSLKENNKNK